MIITFWGMDSFFPRRRGIGVFFTYMTLKAVVWSAFDVVFNFGFGNAALTTAWTMLNVVMAPLSFAVLWYTWKGPFVKIGLAGLAVDFAGGITVVFGAYVSSLLFQEEFTGAFSGHFGVRTLVSFVVMLAFFAVVLHFVRPLLSAAIGREYQHERALQVLIVSFIAFAAASKITGDEQGTGGLLSITVLCTVSGIVMALYVIQSHRASKVAELYLAESRQLIGTYNAAMLEQSAFVDDNREELDSISQRIACVGNKAAQGDLRAHLDRLRHLCDSLRFGTYSDNAALDAVLVVFEERFRRSGIPVFFYISPLPSGSSQAALGAQVVLEWVYDVVGRDTKERAVARAAKAHDLTAASFAGPVTVRVFSRARHYIFVLSFPSSAKVRFPRRLLAERIGSSSATVDDLFDNGVVRVRLMMEGVGA